MCRQAAGAPVDPCGVGGRWRSAAVVAFGVAYASIAWLLKFVAGHKLTAFVLYRVVLGALIVVALGAGWLTAQ